MTEPAVIAACVTGWVTLCGIVFTFALGYVSRRDEKRIKLEVERQLSHFQTKDEAQLKVAAEWRLKMLERMLDAGGALRMKLNANFAAINKLSRHVTVHGADAHAQTLVHELDAALRDVTTVGGFLTPSLTTLAREFIQRFDAIGHHVVEWANRPTHEERLAGCQEADLELEALSRDMTDVFAAWHQQMWENQEKSLFGDPATAEQAVAAPVPPALRVSETRALPAPRAASVVVAIPESVPVTKK
jgi:hypothetical protein